MIKNKIKIFIIATEQSGDNLGSNLMKILKLNSHYDFEFYGIGGDKMINEGLKITNHLSEFKSLGLFEIILNLNKILYILKLNIINAYEYKPNFLVILAWNFANPIMKAHQDYQKNIGSFLLPMPIPEIVRS